VGFLCSAALDPIRSVCLTSPSGHFREAQRRCVGLFLRSRSVGIMRRTGARQIGRKLQGTLVAT
jgi:hypothetical protein